MTTAKRDPEGVASVPPDNAKNPPPTLGATIYERIAAVMSAVENVPKNGYNKHGDYKYPTDADIVSVVRKPMAEQGITLACIHVEWTNEAEQTRSGGGSNHFRGTFIWRFACGSGDGQFFDVWVPSEASDTGDKAFYKAITNSKKYALLTTFVLETGDDVERDHIERWHATQPPPQATRAPQAPRPQPPAPAPQPARFATAAQVGLIKKLAREYDELREGSGNEPMDWPSFLGQWNVEHTNHLSPKAASEAIDMLQKAKQDWLNAAPPESQEGDPGPDDLPY